MVPITNDARLTTQFNRRRGAQKRRDLQHVCGASMDTCGMKSEICLPDRAVRYVLFQRTNYLVIPRSLVFKVLKRLLPWQLNNAVVGLESALRRRRIKELFNDDIRRDFEQIRFALPERCGRILDIGCGVAGIDVLLHGHFASCNPVLYLLDKSQVERRVYYGFERKGAFYNSLDVTSEVLTANGVAAENIHLLQATDDHRIDIDQPLDLAISLISWGFHYPAETYLDRVYELLRPGGHLILDLRKGTGGEDTVRRRFGEMRLLHEGLKHRRFVAIK
jgi:SAM-dependent methyltransferase